MKQTSRFIRSHSARSILYVTAFGAILAAAMVGLSACSSESYDVTVNASDSTPSTINGLSDNLCSWTKGGQNENSIAGDDYAMSPVVYVANGTYMADKSIAGTSSKITDTQIDSFSADILKSGVNGIVINNSPYSLNSVNIKMEKPEQTVQTLAIFLAKVRHLQSMDPTVM